MKKLWIVSNFLHLCLNNNLAPGPRLNCITEAQVFSNFTRPEEQFRHQRGHQRTEAQKGSINIIQETTTAENGVEQQKNRNIERKLKTL